MIDFDELRGKAESLLGEHADQVEDGIGKLAELAGKQFGHAGQIDQAAEKLKGFVDAQQGGAQANRPRPGPAQAGPRGAGKPGGPGKPGKPGKAGGPGKPGKRGQGKGPRPGPPTQAS